MKLRKYLKYSPFGLVLLVGGLFGYLYDIVNIPKPLMDELTLIITSFVIIGGFGLLLCIFIYGMPSKESKF